MAFGRNPHVVKAQAAERELPGKRRVEYEGHASRARDLADGAVPDQPIGDELTSVDLKLMN